MKCVGLGRGVALGLIFAASTLVRAEESLVFVANSNSNSIYKFVAQTGEYKGVFGSGFVQGVRGLEQNPADGIVYVACRFSGTSTVGSVLKFNPYTGEYLGQVGNGFLENPDDIAFGTDGVMYVSDLKGAGSAILKFNPTTGAYGGIIANGFLGSSVFGAALATAPGNIIYAIGASGTAVQKFNGQTGEYLGVIGSGFFSSGRGLAISSVGGNDTLMPGIGSSIGSVLKFRASDSSYQGALATGGFVPFVRSIATMPNGWMLVRGFSSPTEYIARFVPETGEYKGLFAANWNLSGIGMATEVPAVVSGTLTFNDYVGTGTNRPVVMEVVDNTNAVLDTQAIVVVPSGGTPVPYSFTTYARGTNLRVKARGTRWLKKQSASLTIAGVSQTGVNLVLQNGDVDGSGEVDAADIDAVIAAFGSIFPGPGDEDTDVDGSTEVDAADIDIVIANFGGTDE